MKKSNIILLSLLVFVFIAAIALFIDGKTHKNREIKLHEANSKEIALPSFSTLVAEDGANVSIYQSDTVRIKMEVKDSKDIPASLYGIKNDTLHIYSKDQVFVYTNTLISVIGQKAFINFFQLNTDSLNLQAQGGEFSFNSDGKKSNIDRIDLQADNKANINLYANMNVKKLNLKVDNSTVRINTGNYEEINAKFQHNSELNIWLTDAKKLNLDRDSTSKININN